MYNTMTEISVIIFTDLSFVLKNETFDPVAHFGKLILLFGPFGQLWVKKKLSHTSQSYYLKLWPIFASSFFRKYEKKISDIFMSMVKVVPMN